jgi:FixJ family two-component response regulator
MQRVFLAIFAFLISIAYVALIDFFAAVGAALVQSGLAGPVLVIPGYGPVEVAMAAMLGGTIVGFLAATLACGAIFALIAIANNTRRTRELLAARLPGP